MTDYTPLDIAERTRIDFGGFQLEGLKIGTDSSGNPVYGIATEQVIDFFEIETHQPTLNSVESLGSLLVDRKLALKLVEIEGGEFVTVVSLQTFGQLLFGLVQEKNPVAIDFARHLFSHYLFSHDILSRQLVVDQDSPEEN